MFQLVAIGFAIAGAIAALGPIIVHLLNRRRYRVVDWAAMDFLREALQRSRRILRRIFNRESSDPGLRCKGDVGCDVLGRDGESSLEVGAHRYVDAVADGAKIA